MKAREPFQSRALAFILGTAFGALVGAVAVAWLVGERNAREARFAENDAQLSSVMLDLVMRRFPELDVAQAEKAVLAVLAMGLEPAPSVDSPVVSFKVDEGRRFWIWLWRRDEASLEASTTILPDPPPNLGGTSWGIIMTRDEHGQWTGTIKQGPVSSAGALNPLQNPEPSA